MAKKKPKGKYWGPEVFKGDKAANAAWKKAGKPDAKEWFKTYKPAKKVNKLEEEAIRLASDRYKGTKDQLNLGRASNTKLYEDDRTRRDAALSAEKASNINSDTIGRSAVGALKGQALAQMTKDKQTQEALRAAREGKIAEDSKGALTLFQEQMIARGIDPGKMSQIQAATQSDQGFRSKVDEISRQSENDRSSLAAQGYDNLQGQIAAQTGRAQSRAASNAAQKALEAYREQSGKEAQYAGEMAKAEGDQADYKNQTYLTLKDKAEQAKAEKAQAQMQAAIARGNLNYKYKSLAENMGYKNTKLQVDTQYKYDALTQKQKQKDIENKLKKQGFKHKQAVDIAKLTMSKSKNDLGWEKFNWSKTNPNSGAAATIAQLLAAGN